MPSRPSPAAALLLVALSGQAAGSGVLNIYNWSDYIDPQVLDEFESEYDIHINYDIYDSSEMVDTKLMTGSTGYDIVVHSASFSQRLIPIGVFQEVDFEQLPNWEHVDRNIVDMISANYGEQMMGVPYMWGSTGLSYNVDLIRQRMPDAPVHSAAMVFDPEIVSRFADCGVSLLDDPTSVIPMAMLYLGHPPHSVDPTHLRAVESLLKAVRPHIKYFSSTKMLLDLPSEEVCIAMSWSGDYSVATSRAAEAGLEIELAYTVPSEGSVAWYDVMYIPADAPHPDNARLFLDFMLRPDVIARASNYTGYANANASATALVDPLMTSDIAIYPDRATLARLYPTKLLPPKLERRRARTWTKIKTGL